MIYIKNIKISPKRTKTGFLMWTFSYWRNCYGIWVECYGPMIPTISETYLHVERVLKIRETKFIKE